MIQKYIAVGNGGVREVRERGVTDKRTRVGSIPKSAPHWQAGADCRCGYPRYPRPHVKEVTTAPERAGAASDASEGVRTL